MSVGGVQAADLNENDYGALAQKAFDNEGNTFEILHLNADKLPKLIEGNDLSVEIPPNLRPEPVKKDKKLETANSEANIQKKDSAKGFIKITNKNQVL